MFTGIIETRGKVIEIQTEGKNKHFVIESDISNELKADESVSHDGVCLTVTNIEGSKYKVTAVDETLKKTNLGTWKPGDLINLERAMAASGRFDGHVVQGHVDQKAKVIDIVNADGSTVFTFELSTPSPLMVEKGSVTVNGISLTCFNVTDRTFSVTIIPYTMEHTTMGRLVNGSEVNIEFDIIGKYVKKLTEYYR
ncbi:riboflavin synthase [Marinigracilibium pacificum]|uniref:Riboflavin synthase n=1 Tax=Marinigracilibium pacificum TaxID=2729599 RepID=A0A848IXK3_9BACT|nr:riboflavin synthase [Marinigracilibium pacificum]NMM49253.1 riboflavin synthase [Marinigracilibium pacificum]